MAVGLRRQRKSPQVARFTGTPTRIPGTIDICIQAAATTVNIDLPPMVHCAKRHVSPAVDRIQICQVGAGPPGRGKRLCARCGSRRGCSEVMMNALLQEYLPLAIFIGISLVIGLALLVAPFIVAYRQPDPEKLSAYECGFNAFDDARMKFDVRFYLVAIIFIIFDLEVAFLFPWAITFGQLGALGFWSMMVFLAVLTVGFIYEWKKGALEWD
jgi:NADH-quinone oxidoreductase subunit A